MDGVTLPLATASRGLTSAFSQSAERFRRVAFPLIDWATSRVTIESARLDAWVAAIDPTLSLRTIRARVVAVKRETHDTKTFVLRPNARWTAHLPGSFVTLRLTIEGKAVERSYSISSAPT